MLSYSHPPPHSSLGPAQRGTVLLVDDDEAVLDLYRLALENAGHRVLTSSTGSDGWELAGQHLPDVILSDINIPGAWSGGDLLERMRQDQRFADKPIVMMSGHFGREHESEWIARGADALLPKPFTPDDLLTCVELRLNRINAAAAKSQIIDEWRRLVHSRLPHEFFTPLASIAGAVDLLADEAREDSDDERVLLCDDVRVSVDRLNRTMRNYLLVLDLETKPEARMDGMLSGSEVVEAVLQGAQRSPEAAARAADLHFQIDPVDVSGTFDAVAAIADELTRNACGFSAPGTPIHVQMSANRILTVSDRGRGMSDSEISNIGPFQQFQRDKFEQQGLGLGLWLVSRIATYCRAHFTIASRPGLGSTCSVAFAPPPRNLRPAVDAN